MHTSECYAPWSRRLLRPLERLPLTGVPKTPQRRNASLLNQTSYDFSQPRQAKGETERCVSRHVSSNLIEAVARMSAENDAENHMLTNQVSGIKAAVACPFRSRAQRERIKTGFYVIRSKSEKGVSEQEAETYEALKFLWGIGATRSKTGTESRQRMYSCIRTGLNVDQI